MTCSKHHTENFPDMHEPPLKKRQTTSSSGGTQQLAVSQESLSQERPSNAIRTAPQLVEAFERHYLNQKFKSILLNSDNYPIQVVPPQFAATVRLVAAIESNQTIGIKHILKRIYCYALAKLHRKAQRVENVEGIAVLKIYHYLRLGRKWSAIVECIRSIISHILASEVSETEATGILYVLETGSVWERAPKEACSAALSTLYAKPGIYQRVKMFNPYVNSALCRIPGMKYEFVSCNNSGKRYLHLGSNTSSGWKASSMAAVFEVLSESKGDHSELAGVLCVLLCFLARSEVPLQLCLRGATPRKRWSNHGDIEVMDALDVGLVPELVHALSHPTDLNDALRELQSFSAVSKSDSTWLLNPTVSTRILCSLPLKFHPFWRQQALIVAFRSIPWKFLEPRPLDIKLFLPHLQHTVNEVRHHDGFQDMAPNIRTDLSLTLAEASRFPGMEWKRFVIDQAKEVLPNSNDGYLRSCIAQRESLVYRITGCMDKATDVINNVSQIPVAARKKMHAGIGHSAIQTALNYIQVDELKKAKDVLEAWKPLSEKPSAIEEVVLFRKHVILAKILRFQGRFKESLANLKQSQKLVDSSRNIIFEEDQCDLMCDLADTLRELKLSTDAEHHLRTYIARQDMNGTSARYKLALAECLFAQGRYTEAENMCSEIRSRPNLLRMDNLRLAITQAKISHISSNWDQALKYWTEAIQTLRQFTLTSGHTTRAIMISTWDALHQLGEISVARQTHDQIATLDELAGAEGSPCWIPGLREWLDHLEHTGVLQALQSAN
ncbi:hypothetical protein FQN50_001782 [Emmonsiellopsis sp. PD_5]|nr:hypothetical protein FQN50_001782 [Emmonsiellopsis sp. PD_5]